MEGEITGGLTYEQLIERAEAHLVNAPAA